jgi:quinol monooxygenase YgiN
MTIVVSGEIHIHSDDFDAALALVEPLVAATRAEPGCVAYDFWVDPRDRGRVRVFEEWESPEALAAHGASEHLATFNASLAVVRIESADLVRYEVVERSPL